MEHSSNKMILIFLVITLLHSCCTRNQNQTEGVRLHSVIANLTESQLNCIKKNMDSGEELVPSSKQITNCRAKGELEFFKKIKEIQEYISSKIKKRNKLKQTRKKNNTHHNITQESDTIDNELSKLKSFPRSHNYTHVVSIPLDTNGDFMKNFDNFKQQIKQQIPTVNDDFFQLSTNLYLNICAINIKSPKDLEAIEEIILGINKEYLDHTINLKFDHLDIIGHKKKRITLRANQSSNDDLKKLIHLYISKLYEKNFINDLTMKKMKIVYNSTLDQFQLSDLQVVLTKASEKISSSLEFDNTLNFGPYLIEKVQLLKLMDTPNKFEIEKEFSITPQHIGGDPDLEEYRYFQPRKIIDQIIISYQDMEFQIFQLILNFLSEVEKYKDTNLWVAGGWVRDKLKNLPANDIDFVIENANASEFAKDFSIARHKEVKLVKENSIRQNAKLKIFDTEIDMWTLRKLQYGPVIPATLHEDALHRDLTINSMYYNIKTNQIEDPIGTAREDLEKEVIKTPKDAHTALQENITLLLRFAKFASRYQYRMHYTLLEIDPDLIDSKAYERLSPDMKNKELTSLFHNNKPQIGIYVLYKLGFLNKILNLPLVLENNYALLLKTVKYIRIGWFLFQKSPLYQYLIIEDATKIQIYFCLLVLAYKDERIPKSKTKVSERILFEMDLYENQIKESMKMINNVESFINIVESNTMFEQEEFFIRKLIYLGICYDYLQYNKTEELNKKFNEISLIEIINKYQLWYINTYKKSKETMKEKVQGGTLEKEPVKQISNSGSRMQDNLNQMARNYFEPIKEDNFIKNNFEEYHKYHMSRI